MIFFLVSLLPAFLLLYFFRMGKFKQQLTLCVSFFLSVVFCTIVGLFGSSYRLTPASFFGNYFFFLFTQVIIPQVVLLVLFFLISKDSMDYKLLAIFPLLAGFYSVYLPFCVLFSDEALNAFTLFFKPVIFLCMLCGESVAFLCLAESIRKRKTSMIVLFCLILALILLTPSALDTLYVVGLAKSLWITFSVVYVGAISFYVFVFNRQVQK